mmetsp:Transcript_35595/g.83735  ORF Transcript_35595/g.83735 Transcript_35595/m.83735 type:complete len:623 (+) Transcript_35595:97-1965(+)
MAVHIYKGHLVVMACLMLLSSSVGFMPPQPVHHMQPWSRRAHVSTRPEMRMAARPDEPERPSAKLWKEADQAVQCAENEHTRREFQSMAKPVIIAEADNVTAAVVPFRQGSAYPEKTVTAAIVPSQLGSIAARNDVEGFALESEVQADEEGAKATSSKKYTLLGLLPPKRSNPEAKDTKTAIEREPEVFHGVFEQVYGVFLKRNDAPTVDVLGTIKPSLDDEISSQAAAKGKNAHSLLGMELDRGVQARDRMNARDKKRKSYSLGLDPAAKPKKPETKIESVSKPDSIPDQAAPAKPAMELDTTPSMRADTVNPTAAALSLSMLTPSPEATVASAVAAAKACAKAMGLPAVQEAVAEEKMRVKEVLTHVAPVEALPTKTKASSSQVLRRAAKEAAAEKEEEPVLRTTELEEVPPPPPVEAFDAEKERALAEKELELEEKARIAAAKVEEVARKVAEQEAKLLKMRAEQQRKEMERWAKAAAAEMEEKEEKKKLDKDSADTAARGAAAEEEEAKVVLAAEEAEAEADEKQWYDLTDEDVARRSEETVSLRRDEEAPQASPPAPRVAAGLGQGLALTMAAGVACVSGAWGAVAAGIGSVQEIGAALIVALSGLALAAFTKRDQE